MAIAPPSGLAAAVGAGGSGAPARGLLGAPPVVRGLAAAVGAGVREAPSVGLLVAPLVVQAPATMSAVASRAPMRACLGWNMPGVPPPSPPGVGLEPAGDRPRRGHLSSVRGKALVAPSTGRFPPPARR